ncbi:hypothetical protein [Thioalkalivibrio sp. ALE11]|uniref:hypothetical protein n=1 Tax=Thioalkalivibrio sp. ALE11 TaxID=1265494 RepID=UPI00037AF9F9|nr:hypothetical protein [Thioalkalivibrio sp. ALE11]
MTSQEHTPRRCQAATTRGTRCRNTGTHWVALDRETESLLCPEHQRHAREGRLQVVESEPRQQGGDDDAAGIAWWNGLTRQQRRYWLDRAASASPADAWSQFKQEVFA